MNGRSTYFSPFMYAPRTNTTGNSLQKFNTHDHFGNLIFFSGKSHILENAESLACEWIGSTSGNTTSLYLEIIFSALNCSTDTLVNYVEWLFIYTSRRLRLLPIYSWYVPSWMNILKPRIIWWHWFIFKTMVEELIEDTNY